MIDHTPIRGNYNRFDLMIAIGFAGRVRPLPGKPVRLSTAYGSFVPLSDVSSRSKL